MPCAGDDRTTRDDVPPEYDGDQEPIAGVGPDIKGLHERDGEDVRVEAGGND